MYRVWGFIENYSLLLIIGAIIAVIWANTDAHSYHYVVEYPILFNNWVGADAGYWLKSYGHEYSVTEVATSKVLSAHYLVNDVLMAFFFAIAAKEVWEAVILKNGSLRGKKAATPLFATAGGMFGPIAVYLGLAAFLGSDTYNAVANGWAIPTATDIAFSYLVGRLVFGAGHPAVRFLLLLAIADDAAGLIILAVFYPSGELQPQWLLLSLAAAIGVFILFNWLPRYLDGGDQLRRKSTWVRKNLSFWPYLIAGALCWFGFQESGLHPALGLLPVVPAIPHADRAFG
ncbi:MAG: Na+/H+ antiporter NhaA, partial [Pseudomonadota bacterium]